MSSECVIPADERPTVLAEPKPNQRALATLQLAGRGKAASKAPPAATAEHAFPIALAFLHYFRDLRFGAGSLSVELPPDLGQQAVQIQYPLVLTSGSRSSLVCGYLDTVGRSVVLRTFSQLSQLGAAPWISRSEYHQAVQEVQRYAQARGLDLLVVNPAPKGLWLGYAALGLALGLLGLALWTLLL